MNGYAPERGDGVWLDFNPQAGREQAGRRPTFVLSPSSYNRKVGLALACSVTSRVKGYPFEVTIPEGLPVSGLVLSDQVRSLDGRSLRAAYDCKLPSAVVDEVLQKVLVLLRKEENRLTLRSSGPIAGRWVRACLIEGGPLWAAELRRYEFAALPHNGAGDKRPRTVVLEPRKATT